MIKFFRKIRQNLLLEGETGKYLKYAIGEIVLVVIGILIALSINNWNEERKENLEIREIYYNLLRDIKADSVSFSSNLKDLNDIESLHEQLYQIGIKNDTTVEIENPNYIRKLPDYNPITQENDPFVAAKISNEIIRKEILTYFRNMKDMDDIYLELDDIIRNKMRVYLGERKMYRVSSWFENKLKSYSGNKLNFDFIDKTELIALSKDTEFQQILFEASLKTDGNIEILKVVIEQNAHLISVIKNELLK
jgi:hypothetical protein